MTPVRKTALRRPKTASEKLLDVLHRRHVTFFLAAAGVVMYLTLLQEM